MSIFICFFFTAVLQQCSKYETGAGMTPIEYIRKNNGYSQMKELKSAGFATRDIKALIDSGNLVKIKAGLYRLSELSGEEYIELVDCARAIPKGVLCLTSAISYYDLSTINPQSYSFAVPHEYKPPSITYPPVIIYYFSKRYYSCGIDHIRTKFGDIPIYTREKTICDLFRFRTKTGEDLFIETLRSYLNNVKGKTNALFTMAEMLDISEIIKPFVKGMLS